LGGWLKPRQVLLADLQGTTRGQQLRISVAHCKLDGSEIWWGGEHDSAGNLIQKSTKYRAQIKFIGDDHKEQTYNPHGRVNPVDLKSGYILHFVIQHIDTKGNKSFSDPAAGCIIP